MKKNVNLFNPDYKVFWARLKFITCDVIFYYLAKEIRKFVLKMTMKCKIVKCYSSESYLTYIVMLKDNGYVLALNLDFR